MRAAVVLVIVALIAAAIWGFRSALRDDGLENAAVLELSVRTSEPPTDRAVEIDSVAERASPGRGEVRAPIAASALDAIPAGHAILDVRVLSIDDETPVARVMLSPRDARIPRSEARAGRAWIGVTALDALTDEAGRASLVLPADWGFRLHARGFAQNCAAVETEAGPLPAGARTELVVHVPTRPDVAFHGRLVDEIGRPIDDAHVMVLTEHDPARRPLVLPAEELRVARSGADGIFRVELASWRDTTLLVEAAGFSILAVEPARGHETADDAARIELRRAGTIVFRAVDRAGSPLRGATIHLQCRSADSTHELGGLDAESKELGPLPLLRWSAELDADGSVTLRDVPTDNALSLELYAGVRELRREPGGFFLEPGEARAITWTIGGGCRVTGEIVDQRGEPLTRQELWLLRPRDDGFAPAVTTSRKGEIVDRAVSDALGRFALDDVPSGSWSIGPPSCESSGPGCDFYPLATRFEVAEDAVSAHVVVRVARGLSVSGRVEDPDGRPVAGARIDTFGLSLGPMVSGLDGRFRIGQLPALRVLFTASCTGCAFAPARPVDVEVTDTNAEIVLRLRPGATISGSVLDDVTHAGARALVHIRTNDPDEPASSNTYRTNGEGRYEVPRLLPGRYELRAETLDGRIGRRTDLELAEGAAVADIDIVARRSAKLVLDAARLTEERRVEAVVDGIVWDDCWVEPGDTCILVVPHGPVTLRSKSEDKGEPRGTMELELAPGEVRTIEVARIGA